MSHLGAALERAATGVVAPRERRVEDVVSDAPPQSSEAPPELVQGTFEAHRPHFLYGFLTPIRQMAQLAGQMETAMLSALERRDAAALSLLKARQDLELATYFETGMAAAQYRGPRGGIGQIGRRRQKQLLSAHAGTRADQYDEETQPPVDGENAAVVIYKTIAAALYETPLPGGNPAATGRH